MSLSYLPALPACRRFLQALHLPWSKPQLGNLLLLTTAFLTERSLPIRRLARTLAGPGPEHRYLDKRLRRFLGSEQLDTAAGLTAYLAFLLPRFASVPYVPVVLDWTFVGRTYAVLWAQIPYRGRSFPLYALVLPYGRQADTQTEIELLALLRTAWPKEGPRPILMADAGFPKSTLLSWLLEHGWSFVIRAHGNVHLSLTSGGRPLAVAPSGEAPGRACYFPNVQWQPLGGLRLHVVVSTRLYPDGLRRWVLFTNLPEERLAWARQLYAHRMQPEQTHRDGKRGHFVSGYGLSHLKRLRADRLGRLLFCLGLIYALLVLLAETQPETRAWLLQRHWGLSLSTFGLDLVRAARGRLMSAINQALACAQLRPLWLETGDS